MATKKKFRTNYETYTTEGEKNDDLSKTMPGMHNDPRTVIENHVRGINPITGAILDNQMYYGDAILPYAKDLTFEELKIKREELEAKAIELNEKWKAEKLAAESAIQEEDKTEGDSEE